jgi:RNA polymerase sigma-70 factor, ECF subfamily
VQPEAGHSQPSQVDLEQLMKRYQDGEAVAARILVDRLSTQLYLFFSTSMGNRAEAEDMLQEAWLRIHRVRHTYRAGEPVLPWIYAIARHVRVDSYRRRQRIARREVASEVLPEAPAPEPQPPDLPSFSELMAELPESQREVLTMLKLNGLSIEEVARATASTAGAVKQKAHRAYDRLRSLLEKRGAPARQAKTGLAGDPGGGKR